MRKGILGIIALIAFAGAYYLFYHLPVRIDAQLNAVNAQSLKPSGAEAMAFHDSLRVADLHTDTTLWLRDPAKRHERGHVDLPRLQEGGVILQVFSATTQSPAGQNYRENSADSDRITALTIVQRWPIRSWGSIYERAAYQARRLQSLERRRSAEFKFVRSASDLEQSLAAGKVAGLFLIEGGHPLEGKLENLDRLYTEGLRIIGLQHFFDNELGGSLHGLSKAGLTEFGRQVIRDANQKSIIIDVAHSSEATVRDVLALSTRPLIVSHTGMRGQCDSPRNFSDELMQQIADAGGLIGIGFWPDVVCGLSTAAIAEAIVYAVTLLGVEHVALGSDFDGTITSPIDASQMSRLTQALLDADLTEAHIRAVMGENAIRFFLENLPQ